MRLAFVGCGYVADFYVRTLRSHPTLELACVMDRNAARAAQFSSYYRVRTVPTLRDVLDDPRIDLVANLTNPSSHYEVSKAALEAGKHVYSEKPLAMSLEQAEELVAIARSRGLHLGGAPCSVLGEAAQTLWRELRKATIGKVRLVHAELDDGPVHMMGCEGWRSDSGAPWPCKDEFEVGCTLEHAGYYVTWFVNFFGPAKKVTSFSTCLVPDKGVAVDRITNDFTVACIEFESGVVARLTCALYGHHDRALRIYGDEGVLSLEDCWNYGSPVRVSRRTKLGLKAEKYPFAARLVGLGPKVVAPARKYRFRSRAAGANPMDMARGIAEIAEAVRERRPARMSPELALHVNEIVLSIQNPAQMGSPRTLTTTCSPMTPMPWAT